MAERDPRSVSEAEIFLRTIPGAVQRGFELKERVRRRRRARQKISEFFGGEPPELFKPFADVPLEDVRALGEAVKPFRALGGLTPFQEASLGLRGRGLVQRGEQAGARLEETKQRALDVRQSREDNLALRKLIADNQSEFREINRKDKQAGRFMTQLAQTNTRLSNPKLPKIERKRLEGQRDFLMQQLGTRLVETPGLTGKVKRAISNFFVGTSRVERVGRPSAGPTAEDDLNFLLGQ